MKQLILCFLILGLIGCASQNKYFITYDIMEIKSDFGNKISSGQIEINGIKLNDYDNVCKAQDLIISSYKKEYPQYNNSKLKALINLIWELK